MLTCFKTILRINNVPVKCLQYLSVYGEYTSPMINDMIEIAESMKYSKAPRSSSSDWSVSWEQIVMVNTW